MSIKCNKCGESYSSKVYRIHKKICKGNDPVAEVVTEPVGAAEPTKPVTELVAPPAEDNAELKAYIEGLTDEQVEAIRARGKDLKIPAAHNKGLEKLIPEIKALEAAKEE